MGTIGYARVSTDEQSTAAQAEALRAAGCQVLFEEHASGASRDRPALRRALDRCGKGDVLVVARIDRLARSLAHLLEVIAELDRKGAGFRSLGDPIDTTSPQGRFTLQILGAVAEFERSLIRERTVAGLREAVRGRGARLGNPGVVAGDARAVAKAARARDKVRSDRLLANAGPVVAAVLELRPGRPWEAVARRLRARGVPKPGGGEWTRAAVARAARRLAREGHLPLACLGPAPRRRDSDDLLAVVAGIAKGMARRGEPATLTAIGAALEDMRQPTPRGSAKWSRSSVKNLLDRARTQGYLPAEQQGQGTDQPSWADGQAALGPRQLPRGSGGTW